MFFTNTMLCNEILKLDLFWLAYFDTGILGDENVQIKREPSHWSLLALCKNTTVAIVCPCNSFVFANRLRSTWINCPRHRQTCESGELECGRWGCSPRRDLAAGFRAVCRRVFSRWIRGQSERRQEESVGPSTGLRALALWALLAFHPLRGAPEGSVCRQAEDSADRSNTVQIDAAVAEGGKELANMERANKSLLPWQDAVSDV